MLIASFIFVMSMAAVVQFAVLSWRNGLLRTASAQVVNAGDPAAGAYRKILEAKDFKEIMGYQNVCPELGAKPGLGIRTVKLYYQFLERAKSTAESLGLSGAAWMGREMGLCTRYAAVVMIQRLERNQELAADLRGF